jgi:hypothetical protein
MASTDVFSKLSRILETHNITTDDKAIDQLINVYINDSDKANVSSPTQSPRFIGSPNATKKSSSDVIRDRWLTRITSDLKIKLIT